jgi:hypothetical protein
MVFGVFVVILELMILKMDGENTSNINRIIVQSVEDIKDDFCFKNPTMS